MARFSDKDNFSFYFTLLKLIPYRSKIIASELYHSLRAQGFDKSLRTVQRVLKKLAEEYEIECDMCAQPYGYSRYSSSLPMSSLSGSQAVFLKMAEKELADKVPSNLIRAMTPLFNDANVVLRSGNQYAPEKCGCVMCVFVIPLSLILILKLLDNLTHLFMSVSNQYISYATNEPIGII